MIQVFNLHVHQIYRRGSHKPGKNDNEEVFDELLAFTL